MADEAANKIGVYDLIGDHETQVSEGGEGDVHKDFINCTKNPGHETFIPVEAFTVHHLPEGHRDENLFEFIKAIANLTVRVDVKMTSEQRPDFWPGSKAPYPFSYMRGSKSWRRGSGRVSLVNKYTLGYKQNGEKHLTDHTTCRCHKCRRSGSPSDSWWDIEVLTATQVVYDEIEAGESSCRLFYDRADSPVVTLDVVGLGFINVERDWCRLSCVTCDDELGSALCSMKKCCNSLWPKVHDKYRESRDVDRLMFIVSHPHGCSKQISIGQWQDKYLVDDSMLNYNKFSYTTSTCPGSSGATVYCLGYSGWWLYQLVHSGTLKTGLNYSGSSFVL
ncbi:hypothetical protein Btru_075763 [Bulinus truncatus]|nr:hypothetical protein Btru_075763 [Bulinus truncatus]